MSRNSRPGTYRPSTTRHTVSGTESTRPAGPQSQLQNATDTSSAMSETPTVRRYTSGSRMRNIAGSSTTNSATTSNGFSQPLNTARLNAIGMSAAVQTPTYG